MLLSFDITLVQTENWQTETQRTNKKDNRFCSHYIKAIHVLQDIIFVLASNAIHFRNLKMFG